MKVNILMIAMLLALSLPAVAAETAQKPQVDPRLCQQLTVDYQKPADPKKSPDYVSGVDVNGKPVVEADLDPYPNMVPAIVTFPLTVDVAQYAGLSVPAGVEMKAQMGVVAVDTKTGKVTYNGQPLEPQSVQAIRDLCAPAAGVKNTTPTP